MAAEMATASKYQDFQTLSHPRVSLLVPEPHQEESTVVVRRLSTPFHGLPSVVDYDPDTGYITFGEKIQPPPKIEHPRRYREPLMPVLNKEPGTCRHYYCWSTRRRLYGLNIEDQPIGLPWSSGLLKYLPGHLKYKYPIHKSYKPKPPKKKKRVSMTHYTQDLRKLRGGMMDEMINFYKVIMLAGYIIREARVKLSQESEAVGKGEDEGEKKPRVSEKSATRGGDSLKNEEVSKSRLSQRSAAPGADSLKSREGSRIQQAPEPATQGGDNLRSEGGSKTQMAQKSEIKSEGSPILEEGTPQANTEQGPKKDENRTEAAELEKDDASGFVEKPVNLSRVESVAASEGLNKEQSKGMVVEGSEIKQVEETKE